MGACFLMSEYFQSIFDGLKTFLTGMGLTWKHFANKKDLVATLQYPNEKWPIADRNIGFDNDEINSIMGLNWMKFFESSFSKEI